MASHEAAVWESSHQFYFDSKTPVTPTSLAENLIGLDGVLRRSADVIGLMVGLKIDEMSVVLTSVELNSYKDEFWFRLIFGKGRAAEKKLDDLRKKLHLDGMDSKKVIGFAISAVVLWGIWKYASPEKKEDPAIQVHIENSFNNLGGEVGLSREEVIELVEAALKNKKEDVKKHVVKLTRPDGHDGGGSVTIDGKETLRISDKLVDLVPKDYQKEEPKERMREFTKKEISLRAVDLDRPNSGWWALVPDISDFRLPVSLGEELDPGKTPVGKYVTGDFSVVDVKSTKGEYKPKRIILHRIHRN